MKPHRKIGGNIWIIVLAAILLVAGGLSLVVKRQREKLASLTSSIAALKQESVPIRFRILSRANNRIALKLKLYDMDDREIATLEHTLTGTSLFVDFVAVPVDDKYLAFPKAIFTEAIPADSGLDLFPYYDDHGFPQVFATHTMDKRLKTELTLLFSKLKQGESISDAFGSAVHDIREFRSFDIDVVYRVVTRLKGGLEIIEDKK